MKRIAFAMAGLGLIASPLVRAADDEVHEKVDTHKNLDGSRTTSHHKKVKRGRHTVTQDTDVTRKRDNNGATTTEVDSKTHVDRPGMGNDATRETKETVKRDAAGRVIEHDKTTTH